MCYLQSTVKPPAVRNFTRITLPFVYIIGVGGYTIIMYVGEQQILQFNGGTGFKHALPRPVPGISCYCSA